MSGAGAGAGAGRAAGGNSSGNRGGSERYDTRKKGEDVRTSNIIGELSQRVGSCAGCAWALAVGMPRLLCLLCGSPPHPPV